MRAGSGARDAAAEALPAIGWCAAGRAPGARVPLSWEGGRSLTRFGLGGASRAALRKAYKCL